MTTRQAIVDAVRAELEPLPAIEAFWEGGAGANDRVDEWSDMDLYVQTGATRIEDAKVAVERALGEVSRIQATYVIERPASERICQVFYRLEGLTFVRDGQDLHAKAVEALGWFRELTAGN